MEDGKSSVGKLDFTSAFILFTDAFLSDDMRIGKGRKKAVFALLKLSRALLWHA